MDDARKIAALTLLANNEAKNAETLKDWVDSMVERRNELGYSQGVEVNARDALQLGLRIASSVAASSRHIAEAIRAILEETHDPK